MYKLLILSTFIAYVFGAVTFPADYDDCKKEYDHQLGSSPAATTFTDPCRYKPQIKYIDYPPYIYESGSSTVGIWKDFLDQFFKLVCKDGNKEINYERVSSAKNVKELQTYCQSSGKNCHFSLPVLSSAVSQVQNKINFRPFYSVVGVAFITVREEEWLQVTKSFGKGILEVWPIVMLALASAFISGAIVWLLDTWWNEEEFPRTFYRGVYEGFWWSFVSMTTVGYGDKAPRGILARFYSLFWIMIGITIISILTSVLSNALTQAVIIEEIKMADLKVGHLPETPVARSVIAREHGIAIEADSIEKLERLVSTGEIDGIAMDTRQLEYYYKQRLSKLGDIEWKLQNIYNYNQYYGLSFYAVADSTPGPEVLDTDWPPCLELYVQENAGESDAMENFYRSRQADKMDPTILVKKEAKEISLFDTNSEEFQEALSLLFYVLMAFIFLGLSFDLFVKYIYHKDTNITKNAGYVGEGEVEGQKTNANMTKEEKAVADLVDRTVKSTMQKMNDTEKQVRFEILDMSRTIRREMVAMKKRVDGIE